MKSITYIPSHIILRRSDNNIILLAGNRVNNTQYDRRKRKVRFQSQNSKDFCVGGKLDFILNVAVRITRCKDYNYLGILFDTSGADKENREKNKYCVKSNLIYPKLC